MTGIAIIFGYFLTHYLEIIRKQKENKFNQYYKLLKALRIFIKETDLEESQRKELVDKFQNAYFGSTILISRNAHEKIKKVAALYNIFQGSSESTREENLNEFRKAQSDFINCLRKEFFHDKELDFLGYDIKWRD